MDCELERNTIMSQHMYILDGGMGHMIKRLGVTIDGAQIGSIQRFHNITMANLIEPELVQSAHIAFLEAGCNIITTNNYAAVPKCLHFQDPSVDQFDLTTSCTENPETQSKTIAEVLKDTGFFEKTDSCDKKVF